MIPEDHRTRPMPLTAEQRRLAVLQSATPREIPFNLALEAIRYHAASEQQAARMGAFHPEEAGCEPVEYHVLRLLAEVREIQSHTCDFGSDRDSICGVCGLDPRA